MYDKLELIKNVISDLESGDSAKEMTATQRLRMLTKDSKEYRGTIADVGGIRPLANLLRKGQCNIELVDEAVTALYNLSIHKENKITMRAEGVIELLTEVMQTGSMKSKENAAATLFSLAMVDENKVFIGATGAIPPLVDLLLHSTEQGRQDACKALFSLSLSNTNKRRIVEAGGVRPLIAYLQEKPNTQMAEMAVSVLANLSRIPTGSAAIAADDEAISALLAVSQWGTRRGKQNAAATLRHLARNCEYHRRMILEEAVDFPPLVTLDRRSEPFGPPNVLNYYISVCKCHQPRGPSNAGED